MHYARFTVTLEDHAWYLRGPSISIEMQLTPFRTRRFAIQAAREQDACDFADRLFAGGNGGETP